LSAGFVVVSHADAGFSVGGFALSPDATSIAIAGRRTVGRDRRNVIAVSHEGGPPREILQLDSEERIALQTWTHDSRGLIYTSFKPGNPAPHEVWYIAADGGAARPLGLSIDGFTQVNSLTIRPDGGQIAFTRGGAIDYELWTIDHFLP
jgi:Tol biopolymer transport system component